MRAAEVAGLATVPVVEREASDDEMLTLALVENLQREDLNPIEKAKGFKSLIERFSLTQEEAAKRIGKDRSTVANFVRLLELPEAVRDSTHYRTLFLAGLVLFAMTFIINTAAELVRRRFRKRYAEQL